MPPPPLSNPPTRMRTSDRPPRTVAPRPSLASAHPPPVHVVVAAAAAAITATATAAATAAAAAQTTSPHNRSGFSLWYLRWELW